MSSRYRRLLSGFAAAGVAAALLSACGGSASTSSGSGGKDGILRVADAAELPSLDPSLVSPYFTSGGDRAMAIFGSLMKYDDKGETVPAMAESFTSTDGVVWTLKLRSGVKFTDGTAYDAAAVKYNLERTMAPDSQSPSKSQLDTVKSVTVVDPLTLRFVLSAKNGSFSSLFTQGGALGMIGSPTALKKDPKGFGTHPVGAGPFKLKSWVRDSTMVLVRNPTYWDKSHVKLSEIDYKIYTDQQSMAQALRSGDIDLTTLTLTSVWKQFANNSQYKVYQDGPPGAWDFFLNASQGIGKSLQVRQAVQAALDPKASNKVLNPGFDWDASGAGCLPFPAKSPECSSNAPTYDLAKAKSLIAAYKASGGSATMTILTANNTLADEAKYIQQVLTGIGMSVKLNSVDVAQYTPAVYKGDFDAVVSAIPPFPNAYPKVFNVLDTSGSNYPKQHDTQLEQALIEARDGATTDERAAAWKQAMDRANDQALAIWLAPFPNYPISTSKVHLDNDWTAAGGIYYPADISIG